MNWPPPQGAVGAVIAVVVLVVCIVFMALGVLDLRVGGLIGSLAVARLL